MKIVRLDAAAMDGFPAFHETFSREFGFPDYYGRNMDAWIDCMSSLDVPEDGLSDLHCARGEMIALHLSNVDRMPDDVFAALNECTAFVNWRRVEAGQPPLIALSYFR